MSLYDLEPYRRPARRRYNKKYYMRSRATATNCGKRWTAHEIQLIRHRRFTDTAISKIIGRSVEAIQIKRTKI